MLSHCPVVLSCFPGLLQMWSPCCLLDVSQMWSPSCLPDVVPSCCFPVRLLFSCLWPISHMWFSQLSPRFGFPDIGSWPGSCFVVFHLFPRCGLPVVSQMWFLDVVSLSGCCLVVFDLSPTCGLSSCLLDLVSQMLAPGLVVVLLSSTSFPDAVSQLSPRCGFWGVVSHSCCGLVVFHLSPR